jgi:hypothetical protein
VGKTHLAVGLGLKAIEHGYRVLFTTAAVLIAALTRALAEGRLDDKLKVYTVPRLLIVDEIGYLRDWASRHSERFQWRHGPRLPARQSELAALYLSGHNAPAAASTRPAVW